MPNLFIANTTRQVQQFSYSLLEQSGHRTQTIHIGSQIKIPDLSSPDIENIIKQHARYGMVEVGEIDRTKPFVGMCYSVDKEISVKKITTALLHNDEVLMERGKQIRQEAAVATHNTLDETVRGEGLANLTSSETSFVEEEPRGGYDPTRAPVGEGTRVEPQGGGKGGKGGGKGK